MAHRIEMLEKGDHANKLHQESNTSHPIQNNRGVESQD